ncbi:septal ring lytic transglycosylase RlpA family protein [Fodinibius sp.]|uniref:septal ring lytic transglycosylase RlpA family protein n=1 Tax=Fodinibius sp. TaxID=1872440 RepID=UPI002ACD3CA0|nr:septal ring lytic transglycosylase RlpA family protein [Fodinibius sp.]MDZ7658350.1 septal ring lytic transglycosylase RlpA family protein [Fodinibius sp.]
MRYLPIFIIAISLFISSCGTSSRFGKTDDAPKSHEAGEKIEEGVASWYGPNFDGKLTANGETYDMYGLTAAHRTLPFNTVVKVKNLNNGKSVAVRINDRGPYAKNRVIDLSKKAADKIDMLGPGTAPVELILLEGDLKNSRVTNLKVPTYTVQLASFNREHQARAHAKKIRGARVEKIKMGNKTVYRVYHGIYTDKNNARKKQRQLKRQGFSGYVKQIEN